MVEATNRTNEHESSKHVTVPVQTYRVAEIEQHADLESRRLKVVDDLRFIPAHQLPLSFDLHDNCAKANHVSAILLPQQLPPVHDGQEPLRFERNVSGGQLDLHRFLVNRFQEASLQLIVHRH